MRLEQISILGSGATPGSTDIPQRRIISGSIIYHKHMMRSHSINSLPRFWRSEMDIHTIHWRLSKLLARHHPRWKIYGKRNWKKFLGFSLFWFIFLQLDLQDYSPEWICCYPLEHEWTTSTDPLPAFDTKMWMQKCGISDCVWVGMSRNGTRKKKHM